MMMADSLRYLQKRCFEDLKLAIMGVLYEACVSHETFNNVCTLPVCGLCYITQIHLLG